MRKEEKMIEIEIIWLVILFGLLLVLRRLRAPLDISLHLIGQERIEEAIGRVIEKYGDKDRPTVEDYRRGRAWGVTPMVQGDRKFEWNTLINAEMFDKSYYEKPVASLTAKRIKYIGDDGYGYQSQGIKKDKQ